MYIKDENLFSNPSENGLISICIVTRNSKDLLGSYLDSVLSSISSICKYEIIVVDNDSTDGTKEMLDQRFPETVYIFQSPGVGFTKGINKAIQTSKGEYVLISTPSTEVIGNAIPILVEYLKENIDTGMVGPKVLNPDGTTQYSSKKMPTPKVALFHSLRLFGIASTENLLDEYFLYNFDSEEPKEVTSLTMSLLLVRRKVFEDVGFLDENLFVWASDVDWCFKVENTRWRQFFLPKAKVYHKRNRVSKKQPYINLIHYHNDLRFFYKKHYASKNGLVANLFWELLLQIRFILQLARYLVKNNNEYTYY
jgi:GT2 family glycosyltransferase